MKQGEKFTKPMFFTQSIDDFIKSEHSRESLCKEHMSDKNLHAFNAKLRNVLEPYSNNGKISYDVCTRITWGIPVS
jgi:hypothetical protein